jgi:hypothetical protein
MSSLASLGDSDGESGDESGAETGDEADGSDGSESFLQRIWRAFNQEHMKRWFVTGRVHKGAIYSTIRVGESRHSAASAAAPQPELTDLLTGPAPAGTTSAATRAQPLPLDAESAADSASYESILAILQPPASTGVNGASGSRTADTPRASSASLPVSLPTPRRS